MKGQSVNLSWLIGTAVFLSALVFSITFTFENYLAEQGSTGLEEQITNIRDNMEDYAEIEVRRTPLIVNGPELKYRIPVKEDYVFSDQTEDAVFDQPYEINQSGSIIRSTVNTSTENNRLTQFYSGIETESFSSDVEGGSTLSNSYIEVDPGGDGVEQISFDSQNLMRNESSFSSDNFTVVAHSIYGETLGGDLEIYEESPEIVLETPSENNYYFRNFTDLYWSNGSTTETLAGDGDFQSGKTQGLVLHGLDGSDYGAAFAGDLDADVSKPDNRTVNVSVDADEYRLYLFRDSIEEGKDRISFRKNGNMFFGSAAEFTTLSVDQLENMNNWDETQTRNILDIEGAGYNITLDEEAGEIVETTVDTVSEWQEGSFKATTPQRNGDLRIGFRNTNSDLVGFWRFDADSDPLDSASEVRDYSDFSNNGNFSSGSDGDERSAQGVFDSSSFSFDGTDDYVNISDSSSLTVDREITLSAWIKPRTDKEAGIIQKSTDSEGEYELSQFNDREIGFALNPGQGEEEFCFSGTNQIELDRWNHVTGEYDPEIGSDDLEVYVNGELVNTCSYSGSIQESSQDSRLFIGNDRIDGGERFEGLIDEVKIYRNSISSEKMDEISAYNTTGRYRGNYTSKTFDFDERVSFDSIEYNASIDTETEVKIRFESVNPAGNVVDSSTFSLSDGENEKTLDVNGQQQARVNVFGSSTNASKSWRLDRFVINYDDQEKKVQLGFNIPFQDVTISRRTWAGVENDGQFLKLEDRVAVWP